MSVICLGTTPWEAFFQMLSDVFQGKFIRTSKVYTVISSFPSVYSAVGSKLIASLCQCLISVYVFTGLIVSAYFKSSKENYLAVLLLISIVLFTPYCQIYDLALIDLSLLWCFKILFEEQQRIYLSQGIFLCLLWMTPVLQIPVACYSLEHTGTPYSLTVPILLIFYTLILKRLWYNDISQTVNKE